MTTTVSHPTTTCDPQTAVRRSLLGHGMLAGPLYVTVSLAQAATRDGFDLTRHAWSLLANGPQGWIQVINLILAGAMVLAFAVRLRRSMTGGRGATWAPRSTAVYGASLVAAGGFRADPRRPAGALGHDEAAAAEFRRAAETCNRGPHSNCEGPCSVVAGAGFEPATSGL